MVSISKFRPKIKSLFSRFFSFWFIQQKKTIVASSFTVVAYSAFSSGLYYAGIEHAHWSKTPRFWWSPLNGSKWINWPYLMDIFKSSLLSGNNLCISENKSIVVGVGTAIFVSIYHWVVLVSGDKWGFMVRYGSQLYRCGTFAIQQKLWKKQFVPNPMVNLSVKHQPIR